MTIHKLLHRRTGAAFLEAIIAAGILILVLCSVLAIVSQAYRYVTNIRLAARSSQILQQKMEDLRLLTWTSMQSLPATFTDSTDTNRVYDGKIDVADYDFYSGTVTVKRVTLSVSWTNRSSRVVTNRLTTLIANGGLNKYIF